MVVRSPVMFASPVHRGRHQCFLVSDIRQQTEKKKSNSQWRSHYSLVIGFISDVLLITYLSVCLF